MDINNLIQIIGCLSGGGLFGWIVNWGFNRRKAASETVMAEAQAEKTAIECLHASMNTQAAMYDELLERCKDYQRTIAEQTDRTREISNRYHAAEQESNRLNEENKKLLHELGHIKAHNQHLREWHCRRSDCDERRPPNPAIRGTTFREELDEVQNEE